MSEAIGGPIGRLTLSSANIEARNVNTQYIENCKELIRDWHLDLTDSDEDHSFTSLQEANPYSDKQIGIGQEYQVQNYPKLWTLNKSPKFQGKLVWDWERCSSAIIEQYLQVAEKLYNKNYNLYNEEDVILKILSFYQYNIPKVIEMMQQDRDDLRLVIIQLRQEKKTLEEPTWNLFSYDS